MSDVNNIPFEIQTEIMRRLPVKSLLRFRSVSKSYKSLIHSSDFIIRHISQHQHQQQHLLLRCYDPSSLYDQQELISIVDDDNHCYPTQRVSFTLPELVEYSDMIGSSHGLLCFYRRDAPTSGTARVLIFNPSIRKTLAFVVPRVEDDYYTRRTVLGFGVCPKTTDPKIVKITASTKSEECKSVEDCIPWQVEVFTLSTRAWRSPHSTNFPRKSIYLYWSPVVLDGCLYWLAGDHRLHGHYNSIISFDMTSEEFREVNLPDSLSHGYRSLSTYKLSEFVAVINPRIEDHKLVYDVWMMVDDDPKWFKMLYTISSAPSPGVSIGWLRGFRKTGEALIEVILGAQHGSPRMLAAYDPYSKSISNVGSNERSFTCFVYSYIETLLLL